ncbi:MAG: hypothetical protein IMZ64_02355 [Bacteroidetes bacterium]|nr:hypothetical protein [Bacteroidota bacterium]
MNKPDKGKSPDENGCYLSSWGQCCCKCAYHFPDFYHCGVSKPKDSSGCVCSILKGWICACPIDDNVRVHSEWPEHSLGCELYVPDKRDRFRLLKGLPPKKADVFDVKGEEFILPPTPIAVLDKVRATHGYGD